MGMGDNSAIEDIISQQLIIFGGMKAYLLIGANLLILILVSYFIVDPSRQFQAVKIDPLCLQVEGSRLCAACYQRDRSVHQDRAFKIESSEDISVLKMREQQRFLTCHEYLQLISFEKDSKNEGQISIELLGPIRQILQEMKAELVVSKAAKVIEPSFNQFIIYKWENFENELTKVYLPNTENYALIRSYFVYGVNFFLLLVLVAWIADSTFLAEQTIPVKISLALIVGLIEIWLLQFYGQGCLFLCRLLTWNLGLLRLKVDNFIVMLVLAAGLFFTYFQVTVPLYIACIMVLIFYYGRGQSQSSQIQRYLLVSYFIFLINHVYIYSFVYLLNDFRNIAVDLCLIVMVPLGLFLLPNQKKFRPYRPIDPQNRSISLSGYDEQESTNM